MTDNSPPIPVYLIMIAGAGACVYCGIKLPSPLMIAMSVVLALFIVVALADRIIKAIQEQQGGKR